MVTGGSYTLGSGQRVDGSLIILSSNADLLERSLVSGSIVIVYATYRLLQRRPDPTGQPQGRNS